LPRPIWSPRIALSLFLSLLSSHCTPSCWYLCSVRPFGAGPVPPAAAADSAAFAAVALASLLAPVPAAHSRCEMFSKRMVCLASGSSAHVQGRVTNCSPRHRKNFYLNTRLVIMGG
jgi:hypothetical protein